MINIDIVNISGADRGWLWSLSRRLRARISSLLSSQVMFFNIILVFCFSGEIIRTLTSPCCPACFPCLSAVFVLTNGSGIKSTKS